MIAAPAPKTPPAKGTRALIQAVVAEQRQTLLEQWLREQVAQVVNLDWQQVGRQVPISSFGLDSLMAIELQYALETELGLAVSMWRLLEGASVAQLAAHLLKELRTDEAAPVALPLPAHAQAVTHPLAYNQQALLFAHRLAPQSAAYNIAITIHIHSDLDIPLLQSAFQTLLDRHPSLRTTYTIASGQLLQQIHADQQLRIQVIDAHTWSDQRVQARLNAEADRPFDLEQGPIIRVLLFARPGQQHILQLTTHHIAVDLWSLDLLIYELGILYQHARGVAHPALPTLLTSYTDYVSWQQDMLNGPDTERLWAYWLHSLADAPPVLELPIARVRPTVQTYVGALHAIPLAAGLADALRAFARSEGVTLYVTLLAAFQTLLHRYSNSEDILVGSPVMNRGRADQAGVVGCFVNHIVVRTAITQNASFRRLLHTVQETVLAALEHQDLPFPLLVERLQPLRAPGYSPLFQIAFVWSKLRYTHTQPGTETTVSWAGLAVVPQAIGQRGAAYDITLTVFESAASLTAAFQYNTDLFEPAVIARMAEHFQVVLAGIVADPAQSIAQLPLLTASEQSQVLEVWNETSPLFPDLCIHRVFEAQAQQHADSWSICFGQDRLTYRDLNAQSNQIAHGLRARGVITTQPVAIMLDTSLRQIAVLLGVLKAGGVLLCLDPNYPLARLESILEEVAPAVLVTESAYINSHAILFQRLWRGTSCHVIVIDRTAAQSEQISPGLFRQYPTTNLELAIDPTGPGYIVYTSGSTGKPKGIIQSHRSFCQFIDWQRRQFDIRSPRRVAQWASITYDAAYCEIFGALCYGATLCLAPASVRYDPALAVSWVRDERIALLQVVPSFFRQMLRVIEANTLDQPHPLPELELVLLAGEVVSIDLVRMALRLLPDRPRLFNLYGPSEAVLATYYEITPAALEQRAIPIGHAIAGRQILILNPAQQLCPAGVQGEIAIRSRYLTLGYVQRPAETQRAFLQNPHTRYPDPIYRTGDLGRYLPDGTLAFHGRIDNQLKIRGMRVEVDEIEALLSGHTAISECAVVMHSVSGEPADQRLCAYIVPTAPLEPTALQIFLRESLPAHMVPALFVFLDVLPRTSNGKIDRRALPPPDQIEHASGTILAAPRTMLERQIAAIWRELLQNDQIGIYDSFFDLGGHSLLAIQAINQIREHCAIDISLHDFFAAPMIASLAERIETARAQGAATTLRIPQLAGARTVFPMSYAQRRLWVPYQLEPESTVYNMPFAMRLAGPLNVDCLARSTSEIMRRHAILRTTFAMLDGQPIQRITATAALQPRLIDLRALQPIQRDERALQLVRDDARMGFDLEHGPLLRMTVIRLDPLAHIVVLTMHHIVSDGWSMVVLLREFAALYTAFVADKPSPLPELPIQYADYAVWQLQWLRNAAMEAQLTYWRAQLADLPLLQLPTDRPRPPLQTFRGAHRLISIPENQLTALNAISRAAGTSLFMVLLACFLTLLHHCSGQDDLVIGTDAAGRVGAETERLIGFFANQLVLRIDCRGNPTFRELLQRVRAVVLAAYANQDVPFDKVVAALNPLRDLNRTPLFQVKFGFLNLPVLPIDFVGLHMQPLQISGTAKFDLELSLWEQSGQISGFIEYNTDLFDASTITTWAEYLELLFLEVARDPEQHVLDIPLQKTEQKYTMPILCLQPAEFNFEL